MGSVSAFGRLDVFVGNAGVWDFGGVGALGVRGAPEAAGATVNGS